MSRLAERDTVQRIGTAARGQRAHHGVGQPLDRMIEPVRPFEAFGEGGRPGGQRGLTGFACPPGSGEEGLPHDLCLPARAARHALLAGLAVTFIRVTPPRLLWHTAWSSAFPGVRRGHNSGPSTVTEYGGLPLAIRGEHVMTTIQESPRPTAPIGQAVGQAEASLTKLLAGVLAESGTSHEAYLGLQRLTTLGGQASRDAYERDLIDWLRLDGPGARRLADALVSAGLVAVEPNGAAGPADGGIVRLTSQGVALRAAILGASAKITEPMLATIDRDDLETTVRTLNEITRRARGIPARLVTTEESR